MTCPHCGAEVHADRTYHDYACAACGLAGPREVLEALAARLASSVPAADLLAVADKLQEFAQQQRDEYNYEQSSAYDQAIELVCALVPTGLLAEAYEKLTTKGDAHG